MRVDGLIGWESKKAIGGKSTHTFGLNQVYICI